LVRAIVSQNSRAIENLSSILKPMKNNILLSLALASLLALSSTGQVLLTDDFNGTSIDTSLWQPSAAFANSSVTEGGGLAMFVNRGRLLSVANFTGAIDIRGRFRFSGENADCLALNLRTDGAYITDTGDVLNAVTVVLRLQNEGDPGNITVVDHSSGGNSVRLGYANFTLRLNTF